MEVCAISHTQSVWHDTSAPALDAMSREWHARKREQNASVHLHVCAYYNEKKDTCTQQSTFAFGEVRGQCA